MPASSAPNPQLVVETGRLRGASFEVPPGRSEIGRQAGVAILLDDRDVSRRHVAGRIRSEVIDCLLPREDEQREVVGNDVNEGNRNEATHEVSA